jgi:hypothetical protein
LAVSNIGAELLFLFQPGAMSQRGPHESDFLILHKLFDSAEGQRLVLILKLRVCQLARVGRRRVDFLQTYFFAKPTAFVVLETL